MEKEKVRFDKFMDAFSGFFRVVNLVDVEDPLVHVVSDVLGIVMVTSDSGFMGGLNQGIIRTAFATKGSHPDDKTAFVVIGDKGGLVMEAEEREFKFFPGVNQEAIYEQAVEVKNYIVQEVLERRMGRVVMIYPRPISFSAQTIETVNLLPCAALFDKDAESEIARRTRGETIVAEMRKVIVESSFADMVEYLAGQWVTSKLFEVFEDSKLAEFSARAMHLEGSVQRLEKDQKKLKHQFFKASHERIDKGMRESFAATKKKRGR
jgi:ATP synthase F1 gamma subunit